MSMVWPSSRVTTAFFTSDRWPAHAAEQLHFALGDERVDALHLDVEQLLDRRLDLRLRRIRRTLKTTLFCSDRAVAFSVMTGLTITS